MRVREAEQAGCQWDHKEAQAAQLDVLYGAEEVLREETPNEGQDATRASWSMNTQRGDGWPVQRIRTWLAERAMEVGQDVRAPGAYRSCVWTKRVVEEQLATGFITREGARMWVTKTLPPSYGY